MFEKQETSKMRNKVSFAPSTLFYNHGRCPRYWKFAFDAEVVSGTQQIGVQELQVMDAGTKLHDFIQAKLLNDLDIEIEKELKNEHPPIRGFADGVITLDDGSKIILEIKTTSSAAFEIRRNTHKVPGYHIGQVLIYMYIENTDTSLLFYLNRDTFERVIIPVYRKDYSTELDELLTWLDSVEKIIESGKTPVFFKGYRQNSRICKQCPFQQHCAEVGQGTEEIDRLRVLE